MKYNEKNENKQTNKKQNENKNKALGLDIQLISKEKYLETKE